MLIDFQRLILGDRVRNAALVAALRRVIVPGKTTVADLGSGTGFLAFVASRLGAKHCWLYEVSELLDLSRAIARDNSIRNCTFVRGHSREIAEPERVDVVISETLGNLAQEEGVLETLRDARRFLKPRGAIVPQKLRQLVAPVASSRFHDELDVWPRIGRGSGVEFDFGRARAVAFDNAYVRAIEPGDLYCLGAAGVRRTWDSLDFRARPASVRRAQVEWKLVQPARFFGFALWWECELIEGEGGVTLSTAPDAPRTHWEQIWLPPSHASGPIDARAGETLRLDLECDSRPQVKINVKWKTALLDRAGVARVETTQDMRKGYLE